MSALPPSVTRAFKLLLVCSCACLLFRPLAGADDDTADLPRAETLFPQLEAILVGALGQSPTMIQEELGRLATSYDEKAERSVLYPRVSGYGFFYIQREERKNANDTDVGERSYYDLSLTQPVFHWGALRAQAEIGHIYRLIADRNFTEAYQILANRIRDTYLQLVSTRVDQRNRVLSIERSRAQLEITRQLAADGRVPASTVTTAEFALESEILARDRAEFAQDRLLRQFRSLTGNAAFSLADLPEMIPAVTAVEDARALPLRTEYVTRRGYEDSITYFRTVRSLDVERLRLRIAKSELRPKFNFALGLSQDMDTRTTNNVEQRYMLNTAYAGLRVSWSIWDSRRNQSLVRAAQARIRRSEKNLEQMEADLTDAIEAAGKELGFATRALAIAERGYVGSESSHRAAEGLFKEGRVSQEQVDIARLALRAAEYNVGEARRDYLRNVSSFLATIQADPLVLRLQREGRIPR